jgi:5-methylcytosine-specific restriction endonuclease McrA
MSCSKKKLVDSVLRGYPLPSIYLHFKNINAAGYQRQALEVIDGQQRINALYAFAENGLELFDPIQDEKQAKFPKFTKETPCPWARKKYQDLSPEDKEKFNNTPVHVLQITPDNEHEVRDLFIRLQAGMPLTAQEKRDAWPGGYTEFVLQYGGKPEIPRYSGHDFFQKTLKPKRDSDRVKMRMWCAQSAMLFFEHTENNAWPDVGTTAVDDYYYKNLDFDVEEPRVKDFKKVLDKLADLFHGYKGPPIKQHEVLHLVLFIHELINGHAPGWESKFIGAFKEFREKVADETKSKSGDFWNKYGLFNSSHSAGGQNVKTRHEFFSQQMLAFLAAQKKDPQRSYHESDRQRVYLKYKGKCAVCFGQIDWSDLEIHHIQEHHSGGETSIENAVPVHRKCHPKGKDAITFAQNWQDIKLNLTKSLADENEQKAKAKHATEKKLIRRTCDNCHYHNQSVCADEATVDGVCEYYIMSVPNKLSRNYIIDC